MSRSPAAPEVATALLGLVTLAAGACVGTAGSAGPGAEPELPPLGLEAIQQLEFPPLEFDPPTPESFELSNGVTVFFLHDDGLPLVDVFVNLRGGYAYFDREQYAAASGLLPLMRNAGTRQFTPDSLDAHVGFHALGIRTSTDGSRMILGVMGLRRQLDLVMETWSEILLRPRFDSDAVDRWRARELEAVRRRSDFPGSLAVLEFNRLLFGDHPTGWVMTPAELAPDRVEGARLRALHRRVVCPENAVIGASGDVDRDTLRAAMETALAGWEPCGSSLESPRPPTLTPSPRVYVIPNSRPQSTVVVGHPGGVLLEESRDYFASRVANWVIGGSGFTSRLTSRVRTEEGLAYSAASVWGTARTHERIFGAITHTRSESTVEATQVVMATLDEARRDPPDQEEIALAQSAIINGFVFGFGSPAEIVGRQVSYLADGLPADWLTRYFAGIRAVEPRDVARVIRAHVHPTDLTILIVGDTTAFDPSRLGPVTVLDGAGG
jgi:zinc protease